MSTTVGVIKTQLNTYISDSSTDRISDAQRLQYITEATDWYQLETDNDQSVKTYSISYYDTLNYYKINSAISDVLDSNALRRITGEKRDVDFTKKDARQVAIDIA
jgi:hypothetical protein